MYRSDVMNLHRNGTNWNRDERNKTNENWDEIEGNYNNVVENVSDKAFDKVVDSAKLNWKEPVDQFGDLPTDAQEGDTRMVRETGKVYRFDGSVWQEIQEIDATAINEDDSRLTAQLADITINVTNYGLKGDGLSDNTSAWDKMVNLVPEGSQILFPKGTYLGNFISN